MSIKSVGVITYQQRHLKTEQVLEGLLGKGYDLEVFALPFVARPSRQPLFSHRPNQLESVYPKTIAKKHGIPFHSCEADTDIMSGLDIYLVLAGKILSGECIEGKKILNCHAGVIPASRGLDAFKWAIHEKKPLGVSMHYIDKHVDAGEVLAIAPTYVYSDDTLETLARRHYENEILCTIEFEERIARARNPFAGIEPGEPRMRMPKKIEHEMIDGFGEYLREFGE